MPRTQTRAKRLAARIEAAYKTDPELFVGIIRRLNASDSTLVWPLVRGLDLGAEGEGFAIVAQIVGPDISGRTPGNVWKREARGRKSKPFMADPP